MIEMRDKLALGAPYLHYCALNKEYEKRTTGRAGQLRVRLSTKCIAITDSGVEVENADGHRELIPADRVILAVGIQNDLDYVEEFRDTAPEFRKVGDCNKPAAMLEAVRLGYDVAFGL